MSCAPEDVSKLTENTYKIVMDQFNPGLRNLVNLGKSYEKSVTVMTLAGKAYFDAVSKVGENAIVSPVSRELDSHQLQNVIIIYCLHLALIKVPPLSLL